MRNMHRLVITSTYLNDLGKIRKKYQKQQKYQLFLVSESAKYIVLIHGINTRY